MMHCRLVIYTVLFFVLLSSLVSGGIEWKMRASLASCFFRFTKVDEEQEGLQKSIWIQAETTPGLNLHIDSDHPTERRVSASDQSTHETQLDINKCSLNVAHSAGTALRSLYCSSAAGDEFQFSEDVRTQLLAAGLKLVHEALARYALAITDDFLQLVNEILSRAVYGSKDTSCRPVLADGVDLGGEVARLLGIGFHKYRRDQSSEYQDELLSLPDTLNDEVSIEIFFRTPLSDSEEIDRNYRVPKIFTIADRVNPLLCIFSQLSTDFGARATVLGLDSVTGALSNGTSGQEKAYSYRAFKHATFERFLHYLRDIATLDQLQPTDVIALTDGFDVFPQRHLGSLAQFYYSRLSELQRHSLNKGAHSNDAASESTLSHVVIYGGEKNCFPFSHQNVSQHEFDKRACYRHRGCPVDSRKSRYRVFPLQNGTTVLGHEMCYKALNKFSPGSGHGVARFPFLNAGVALGSVHAFQKLFSRYVQVREYSGEDCDQAILLFLSLDENLIQVDTGSELALNLHGHAWQSDFAGSTELGFLDLDDWELVLKNADGVVVTKEIDDNSTDSEATVHDILEKAGDVLDVDASGLYLTVDGKKVARGTNIHGLASPHAEIAVVSNGIQICSDQYFVSGLSTDTRPVANEKRSHDVETPFFLHFNGNGKPFLERCRQAFFKQGLGWTPPNLQSQKCDLVDETTGTQVSLSMNYVKSF